MVPEMKGWRPKKTIYTINDAWEDGYQVGYERGVLNALKYIHETHFVSINDIDGLSEYLTVGPPSMKTKEEWIDILKKAVKG